MGNLLIIEQTSQFNEAVAALIELEAMKAENSARQYDGMSPAYGEKEFMDLMDRYSLGLNDRIGKQRRFY